MRRTTVRSRSETRGTPTSASVWSTSSSRMARARRRRPARCPEPVEIRAADHHGPRPEGQRVHHVGTAPDPAVEQDLDAVADGVGDFRQSLDGGGRPVELAAAVVGDDQAVDARGRRRAARRRRSASPSGQAGPARATRNHARSSQATDGSTGELATPAERHDVGARRIERADQVRPGEPRAEEDPSHPAGTPERVDRVPDGDPRRDGEAVPEVALAPAEHRHVHGQDQAPGNRPPAPARRSERVRSRFCIT